MKSILCFGDSNTYGANPNLSDTEKRFPRDVRWTGVLQNILGPEYYVIEEGYNGRTVCFKDGRDPFRCGLDYVLPVMKTHSPLDLVVVMLGTNDLQAHYNARPKAIAGFLEILIGKMKSFCVEYGKKVPKFLIVAPILIGDKIDESVYWTFDSDAPEKSRQLAQYYRIVADRNGYAFFDASSVAVPGPDELHMDSDSHKALAEALAKEIRSILE